MTTTTTSHKKSLFPALLRHHVGKLFAGGLFLLLLVFGQLNALKSLRGSDFEVVQMGTIVTP